MTDRASNALSSAATAMITLLLMCIWITGPSDFVRIASAFMKHILLISLVASLVGAFLNTRKMKWSLLVGMVTGLLGGTATVLQVVSGI